MQDDVYVLLARRTGAAGLRVSADGVETVGSAEYTSQTNGDDFAQFALEGAGLGYFEFDTATGTAKRSPRHDEIFGYDAPLRAWTHDLFLSPVYEQDHDRVHNLYKQCAASGSDWRFRCRIRRFNDGADRQIEVRGRYFNGAQRD